MRLILQRFLFALALLPLCACGTDEPAAPKSLHDLDTATLEQLVTAFNHGVAAMDFYESEKAVPHFEKVVRLAPAWTPGRLNLGIALLNVDHSSVYPRAEKELRRVIAQAPRDPRGPYSLGMLLTHLTRYDEATQLFQRVLELDPDDIDSHMRLGTLLMEKDPVAARGHLEIVYAAMPHHEAACYRLFTLIREAGEDAKAEEMLAHFQKLKIGGMGTASGIKFGEMGRYADIVRTFGLPRPAPPVANAEKAPNAKDVASARGLVAVGKHAPGWPGTPSAWPGPGIAVADVDGDGDLDVFVGSLAPGEPGRLHENEGGRFTPKDDSGVTATDTIGATFGDYDADGKPDLYVTCAGRNALYRNLGAGRFEDVTASSGAGAGDHLSLGAIWADADHDGDLDLYVANFAHKRQDGGWERGARNALLQNSGTGTFKDVASASGVDGGLTPTTSVTLFDADGDRDQDLYVVNDGAPNRLFLNDRAGVYHEAGSRYAALADAGPCLGAVVADVDADGWEDVLLLRGYAPPTLVRQTDRGRFEKAGDLGQAGIASAIGALAGDVDLDGTLDLVFVGVDDPGGGHRLRLNAGADLRRPSIRWDAKGDAASVRGAVAADLDGDGALELLVARAAGALELIDIEVPAANHWLVIEPARSEEEGAIQPDPSAMGLHAQVQTGRFMQTRTMRSLSGYLGGTPPQMHLGLGASPKADFVRLAWPDAMLQSELEVIGDRLWQVAKVERKPSSCPLLFSWDGERFAYVTDFLGVGGLGFFLSPGTYAPPDPTEDVRVPPEQIEVRDGKYLLRVAEPLEEVTYLDALHLWVYDHPKDWALFPDERFASVEPFPTGKPHAVAKKVFARRAIDDRGRDRTQALRKVDRDYVVPPVDPRFIGFAHDHFIELDFTDRVPAVPAGKRLILFLHGWVEYTYSHVNYAAWQAGKAMQPPRIEVPDGEGGWKTAIEDAGFPAGLPRMMTVDVTKLGLDRVGRLRIRTNMEIFWDQAFLAVDATDERVRRHRLDPSKAVLRFLGYPREYSPDGRIPTCYDYDRIDPALSYKIMAGAYTRYGDVRPLLTAPDDRYVIIGRGEEIELEFDANSLPPLAKGHARTVVLHSEGWCKDMDLYTAFPDTVEPLPYRSMKAYPPATQPDDEAWRSWQATWNTRVVRDTGSRR